MSGKRAPPRLPPPPVPKSPASSPQVSEQYYEELIAKLPTRAPIFLPTERMSLEQRIEGVKRVHEIYTERLDKIYRPKLRALRERFQGRDRCFVIGNGPSLNKTDLSMLRNEVTFAVNGFFLKSRELDWKPTFYVVEDHLVAEDRREWINAFEGPIKLFPVYLAYCIEEADDTIFYNHRPRVSYPHGFDFSRDAAKITYTGCTVTFSCLQLAHYLGFKSTYLIGVDSDYELPKDVEQSQSYGVGVLDMQSDDPNHFNPDYFGKGFRWHDPQVDKMLDAYAEARKVVDQTEQRIYNAGIGGRLEVFERVAFGKIFPDARAPDELEAEAAAREELRATGGQPVQHFMGTHPKLLLLDHTCIGDGTATGEVKATILDSWPADRLLQVYQVKPGYLGLRGPDGNRQFAVETDVAAESELSRIVGDFGADLILYRPVPRTQTLHRFSMDTIAESKTPLATWIMDDWPAVVGNTSPDEASQLVGDFERLLERSSLRLSIGTHMSEAFEKRYGGTFVPFANGVDPSQWPRPRTRPPQTFTVRYAGSLAEDMGLESVLRIAQAVEQLSGEGYDIRFEIKTRPYWHSKAAALFESLGKTTLSTENLTAEEYRAWLSEADVLVIAYNFDQTSIAYVRYSIANKLPESLASGAVVLAHGPPEVATIKVLLEIEPKLVVPAPSIEAIRERLSEHARSPFRRLDYAETGQRWAFNSCNAFTIRDRFARTLADVVTKAQGDTQRQDAVLAAFKALVQTAPAQNASAAGAIGAHPQTPPLPKPAVLPTPRTTTQHPASSTAPVPAAPVLAATVMPAKRRDEQLATQQARPPVDKAATSANALNGSAPYTLAAAQPTPRAIPVPKPAVAPLAQPIKPPPGLARPVDVSLRREAWRQRAGLDIPVPAVAQGISPEPAPVPSPSAASHEPRPREMTGTAEPVGFGSDRNDTSAQSVGTGFNTVVTLAALALVVGGAAFGWLASTDQLPAYAPLAMPALAAMLAGLGLVALLKRLDASLRARDTRLDDLRAALEQARADSQRAIADRVAAATREAAQATGDRIDLENRARAASERQLATSLHASFAQTGETVKRDLESGLSRLRAEVSELRQMEGRITAIVDRKVDGLRGQLDKIDGRVSGQAGSVAALEQRLIEASARPAEEARKQAVKQGEFEARLWSALDGKVVDLAKQQLAASETARTEAIEGLTAHMQEALDAKVGDLAAKLSSTDDAIKTALQQTASGLEAKLVKVSEEAQAVSRRLGELVASDQQLAAESASVKKAVADLAARVEPLKAELSATSSTLVSATVEAKRVLSERIDGLASSTDKHYSGVGETLKSVESRLARTEKNSVSLHLASALRAMRPIWGGGSAVEALKLQAEVEHGHELMLAVLADTEKSSPGSLAGRSLIEIGTTRENDPAQGSTQKLALFTALTGMRFVSVDMDPQNTQAALAVLRYINPGAQAITAKGEIYLRQHVSELHYVYLDAFDFYHNNHSEARQERYRRFLGTEINDLECWRMHADCAETIIARMVEGGIVVLDDTWTDQNGVYEGKGKLAMPLLLDNGFVPIGRRRRTIALRRTSVRSE